MSEEGPLFQESSPDEFLVPASDNKGHSERLWTRIQPGHERQMEIILRSKFFPYNSKGDITRHAIARHLQWLVGQGPIPSVLGQVDAIIEIMREEEFNRGFQEVLGRLMKSVEYHMAKGESLRAGALIARVMSKVADMPEGQWKEAYEKEIKSQFGHLLDGATVSLFENSEGEAKGKKSK